MPFCERCGIENELVAASNQHHGIRRRNRIEIAPQREALFLKLGFVPVAVRYEHVTGFRALHTLTNCREDVGERSCIRQVDARSTTCTVKVTVLESGNNCFAFQINDSRRWSGKPPDFSALSDGGEVV